MRIVLENLSSRRCALELPGVDDTPRTLELEYVTDVCGGLMRTESAIELSAVAAKELQLSGLLWPLARGQLAVATPAMIAKVEIDGRVPLHRATVIPLIGRASLGALNSEGVTLVIGEKRLSLDARLRGLFLEHETSGAGRVELGRVELRNLQANLGSLFIRLHTLSSRGVSADLRGDEFDLRAGATVIEGLTVRAANLSITIDRIDFADGFAYVNRELVVPAVEIGAMSLGIDDVRGFAKPAVSASASDPNGAALDLRVLDQLDGTLEVDLTMDADYPVIGRRKATHHFRVNVSDGIFGYRDLEEDLAALEDAFLDIAVRKEALVLERTIPLMPGPGKPLLIWDLDETDLALARQERARLRRIPHFRRPPSDGKSRFRLRRLNLDSLGAQLSVKAPAETNDSPVRISAGELSVSGRLHYDPSGPLEATLIELSAHALECAIESLAVRGRAIDCQRLRIERIDPAALSFEGLRPSELGATIHGLGIENLRFTL